jgi:metal-responsive CopG/Arc/MetJ family transcriptional regulator
MKKHLATITILSDDRHATAQTLQKIMTNSGRLIRARLGVNLTPACVAQCPGIIVLVVEGVKADIEGLAKKFNKVKSVKAKSLVIA